MDHNTLAVTEVATKCQNLARFNANRMIFKRRQAPSPLSGMISITEDVSLTEPVEDVTSSKSEPDASSDSTDNANDVGDSNSSSRPKAYEAAESIFQAYVAVPTPSVSHGRTKRPRLNSPQTSDDALALCTSLSQSLYDERQEARYLYSARSDTLAHAWYNQQAFQFLPYRKHIRMRPFENGIENSFRHEVFWAAWAGSWLRRGQEAGRVCELLEWHGHGSRSENGEGAEVSGESLTLRSDSRKAMDLEDEAEIRKLEADAEKVHDPTGEVSRLIREARVLQAQLRDTLACEAEAAAVLDEQALETTAEGEDNDASCEEPSWSIPRAQPRNPVFGLQATNKRGESSDGQSLSLSLSRTEAKMLNLRSDIQKLEADLRKEQARGQWRDGEDTEDVLFVHRRKLRVLECRFRRMTREVIHDEDVARDQDKALLRIGTAQEINEERPCGKDEEQQCMLENGYEYI